jgi:hypothetical protein
MTIERNGPYGPGGIFHRTRQPDAGFSEDLLESSGYLPLPTAGLRQITVVTSEYDPEDILLVDGKTLTREAINTRFRGKILLAPGGLFGDGREVTYAWKPSR